MFLIVEEIDLLQLSLLRRKGRKERKERKGKEGRKKRKGKEGRKEVNLTIIV